MSVSQWLALGLAIALGVAVAVGMLALIGVATTWSTALGLVAGLSAAVAADLNRRRARSSERSERT